MKRVVIIGMGFAGVHAARELAGQGVETVLVDRNNYHLFQPLLYQVATAGLEQESIAYPIRAMMRSWPGITFQRAEAARVDYAARRLLLSDGGSMTYDYLIVAAGSATNFFGNQSIAHHSFDLKRLPDAEKLRNHILDLFEKAVNETDAGRRKALMTFVIVGGGPTGVEFAGALAELVSHVIFKDYPELRTSDASILLVEAADRLLLPFPEKLSRYAANKLASMGVELLFGVRVTDATAEQVTFHDGRTIPTHTLFWSAGVCAAPLASRLELPQGGGGRIPVQSDLTVQDHPEVYIAGDMALLEQDGKPLPMVAPVAMQMGRYAARHILSREWGRPTHPFRYRDKGSMATIGKSAAIAMAHGICLKGYPAWLAWLLLHLYYLIGFRNRVVVMLNWIWYYFFHERQVRLITSEGSTE